MTTVMITGAARGLGFEFTKLYAARGWKVLACARKPDRLKTSPYGVRAAGYPRVRRTRSRLATPLLP